LKQRIEPGALHCEGCQHTEQPHPRWMQMLAHNASNAIRHRDHQRSWGGPHAPAEEDACMCHVSARVPPKLPFHDLEVVVFPTESPKETPSAPWSTSKEDRGRSVTYTHNDHEG
jgi:hypothetical protein